MKRTIVLLYGLAAYAAFFVAILYLIGFTGNWVVPKSIDAPAPEAQASGGTLVTAIMMNVALIALFAIQHTIMARPAFKRRWTQIIPQAAERSTFVLTTSIVLAILFLCWQPLTATVWHTDNQMARLLLLGLSLLGWGILFVSSYLIDHFDLFGLRQVFLYFQGREYTHPRFVERAWYKVIRHPLMTGVLMGIWFTPTMTVGHLVFALSFTGYIVMGVTFEERDLIKVHGESYDSYRRRTRKFFPLPRIRSGESNRDVTESLSRPT